MSRYFFALNDDPPEQVGEEFKSDEAALKHGKIVSEELGRNGPNPLPCIAVYKRIA
jgi:hypothetical protein